MMKPIGAALPALGKSGEGAQPGEGRDAAQRLVDVFAAFVEKPSRGGKSTKAEHAKQAPARIVEPGKRADAPSPSLPSDLILAAALPRTDHGEPARTAKPSRKPVKTDADLPEPRLAAALAADAPVPIMEGLAREQRVVPLAEPQDSDERKPEIIAHGPPAISGDAELPAEAEELRLNFSPAIISAKQETHFDTARLAWSMAGSALAAIAQSEADVLPPQRVTTAPPHLDAPQASEQLKSLKIEIGPGMDQNAVTATLKLRHDQLEVRLETADGDMAARLKDAASNLTQSLEQGGYRVEMVVVQKGGATDNAAFLQSMATQEKPGRPRSRTGREGRMGDERANGPRRTRTGGDIIV